MKRFLGDLLDALAGALVGSWTIDSANKAPTGLTIDPSGASQSIWIVDNGTDRVYEYTNSRSRNSGSQSATLSFTLASGNTNPQGIADPPAPTSAGQTSGAPTLDKSAGKTDRSHTHARGYGRLCPVGKRRSRSITRVFPTRRVSEGFNVTCSVAYASGYDGRQKVATAARSR